MSDRNFAKRLASLERDLVTYLEAEEARLSVHREFTDAELVNLLVVYAEIADANQMSYPEALERLLGLDSDEAEKIAGQHAPSLRSACCEFSRTATPCSRASET